MRHPWLRPGIEALMPALYAGLPDRIVEVVDVNAATRQVWVRFAEDLTVREISTFHLRPLS